MINKKKMEVETSSQFLSNMTGSALGNVLTLFVFGFLYALKKLCDRPSKCKSSCHTGCCDISIADRDTVRGMCPIVKVDPGTDEPREDSLVEATD